MYDRIQFHWKFTSLFSDKSFCILFSLTLICYTSKPTAEHVYTLHWLPPNTCTLYIGCRPQLNTCALYIDCPTAEHVYLVAAHNLDAKLATAIDN